MRPASRNFPTPRQGPELDRIVGVTIPRGHGETVLVVAGDLDLHGLAAGLLGALGYRVLQAGDGPSALKELQQAASVDLLITDLVLPDAMTAENWPGRPEPSSRTWPCCIARVIRTRPSDR